MKMDAANDPVL